MTFPQDLFALLCPWNSTEICSSFFTGPLILGSMLLEDFSQPVLCGQDCPEMWVFGLEPIPVHLDLVGPLPSSHGFIYLLTIIDRTT